MKSGFIKIFIPSVLVITFAAFAAFSSVQQVMRQGANSPQLEISEDLSSQLALGIDPQSVFSGMPIVDAEKSLSPFVIVYDENMKVVSTDARFEGDIPVLPAGVFDYAKNVGEDRLTWQPKAGLRFAAVVNRYDGQNPGYVLAARSLREIERTTNDIFQLTFIGWIAGVTGAGVLSLLLSRRKK